MFKILGVLLAVYIVYALARGEVYAKSGISGETISRAERASYFWTVIAIYAGLSIALMTVF